jgi:predicted O-methyltransferase YrrM
VTGPVDLVFLDADKTGSIKYLEKLLLLIRPGGLIVAHNMNEQHADPSYVQAITTNPDLESVFRNLETSGIGVTLKKR